MVDTAPVNRLFAADALLPTGWARNVLLAWNSDGQLTAVTADSVRPEGVPEVDGPLIPGLPNLHSHAFQRAFAGLTEFRSEQADSFWSWRTQMYRFARRITPEQLEAIATWLYIEMLEAGYTAVCEFHYVHHDPDGRPYADDATLSLCLLRAAKTAGIGLTLLPVLYQTAGFGGTPPADGQRRFIRSTDNMLRLLERLKPLCDAQGARLGLAPHSLAGRAARCAARGPGRAERPRRHGAGAHPHRRADRRGRRLPGLERPAAGGMAAEPCAGG